MSAKYFFDANDGRRWLRDLEGARLDGNAAAQDHALAVIREVMRNNEAHTRYWRLRVRDADQTVTEEIAFASVEENASKELKRVAGAISNFAVTVQESEHLIRQLRATMAQMDRKPYLATLGGRRLFD